MTRDVEVKARDLVKRFGDFVAVDRVTFEVFEGEIFGFLGSNGAGKSTTIRMLCGLLGPTEGEASVSGYDVYTQAETIKQNIGYMSQRFSLYDELTVEENLDFFGGVYGLNSREKGLRKVEILRRMGLENLRQTPTRRLPGGWKQRLALGCAVLHEPPVLFLDEPTSGVDPLARRDFWDLIHQLSAEGHTVFVTTHYMDEAEHCHRLALMEAGKIIALDSPEGLRESLAGDHFLQLECSNVLKALHVLEGQPGFLDVAIFGGGLRVRVDDVSSAEGRIRELCAAQGVGLASIEEVAPGMEDVFVLRIEQFQAEGR